MPASTYREAARSGKLADPQARRERGQKAARARTSLDHHIRKVVESAPALTDEQVEQLRSMLPPTKAAS